MNRPKLAMAYIREFEKQIYYYLLQESCTPVQFATEHRDTNPEEWQRAWSLWENWMQQQWKVVAATHAGKPLSDSQFLLRYGEWKDRESGPGKKLLRIINKDKRPE